MRAGRGYDYNEHGRAGNTGTEFVPDEIVERFCLIGPPETQVARLTELAELGVGHFGSTSSTTRRRRRCRRSASG